MGMKLRGGFTPPNYEYVVLDTLGEGLWWTVPAGVTSIDIAMIGGGGGSIWASGGAGGLIRINNIEVTPLANIPYYIGNGGSDANGEATTFNLIGEPLNEELEALGGGKGAGLGADGNDGGCGGGCATTKTAHSGGDELQSAQSGSSGSPYGTGNSAYGISTDNKKSKGAGQGTDPGGAFTDWPGILIWDTYLIGEGGKDTAPTTYGSGGNENSGSGTENGFKGVILIRYEG